MSRRYRQPPDKGFTVPELMISMVIFLALFYMIYQAFVPSIVAWRQADSETEAEQSSLVACENLFRELRGSTSSSVKIYNDTAQKIQSIGFLSQGDLEFSATPTPDAAWMTDTGVDSTPVQWTKFVVFYLSPDQILRKKEALCNQGGKVYKLTDAGISSLILDSRFQPMVVARNIREMNLSTPRYPEVLVDITGLKETKGQGQKSRMAETRIVQSILPRV